jgi:hypothetical protein
MEELSAEASYQYATRLPRPDEIFGNGVLVNLDAKVFDNFGVQRPGRAFYVKRTGEI